jgi:hypothetical protein
MTTDSGNNRPAGISDELRPYIDSHEIEGIDGIGEALKGERPLPRPAFRSELRALLSSREQERVGWRPRRLGVLVAAYLGSSVLLLAIAAIGLAGAGPLSA